MLKPEDVPVPVEPEGKFIHTGTEEEFAAKIKERVQDSKPRIKHAAVDLTEARRLYETGSSINDVVTAVKGTRAEFDVKKLIRKTFKELGILKD